MSRGEVRRPMRVQVLAQDARRAARVAVLARPLAVPGPQPPSFQGWQRASRRAVSQPPCRTPCRRTAVTAYDEQEGANRHDGPEQRRQESAGRPAAGARAAVAARATSRRTARRSAVATPRAPAVSDPPAGRAGPAALGAAPSAGAGDAGRRPSSALAARGRGRAAPDARTRAACRRSPDAGGHATRCRSRPAAPRSADDDRAHGPGDDEARPAGRASVGSQQRRAGPRAVGAGSSGRGAGGRPRLPADPARTPVAHGGPGRLVAGAGQAVRRRAARRWASR